jgi:trypsin
MAQETTENSTTFSTQAPHTIPIPLHQILIVGGQSTTISQVPYQASIRLSNTHICGGSIISKSYILTAAHCFSSTSPSLYSIRVGSTYSNSGGTVIAIAAITKHPSYNNPTHNNDFALLRLKTPIKSFNSNVKSIALAAAGQSLKAGSQAKVSGWGALKESGSSTTRLQVVNVPLIGLSSCRTKYGNLITSQMLCAGYPNGKKDACQG